MGHLEKLKIVSYKDAAYSKPTGDEYTALVNPDQLSDSYEIEYKEAKTPIWLPDLSFASIKPQNLSLNVFFDSTGVLNDEGPNQGKSVPEQIAHFKKVTFNYDGGSHTPVYSKVYWGTFLFRGRLNKLDIKYTLFEPDGTPLRADAKVVFKGSVEPVARTKIENKSSPDLSHIKTVKEGETLPLLAHKVYGDASYYMELARVNKLIDFRKLEPGMKIICPPIDKAQSALT